MGCTYYNPKIGEDYLQNVLKTFKGRAMKFNDVDNWMRKNSTSKIVSESAFQNFINDFIETNQEKNPHKEVQISILNKYYTEHLKSSYLYLELCLFPLLNNKKKENPYILWNLLIFLNGKNSFSLVEFKKILSEYFKINFILNTSCASESPTPTFEIKGSLIENLDHLFNLDNINVYTEHLFKNSEIFQNCQGNKMVIISEFFAFLSSDKCPDLMNIEELRLDFINFFKPKENHSS